MDVKELRESLGIDDYLELVKEDKNCNGAYISFGQYMYLLENEIQELKKQLEVGKEQYDDLVEEKEKIKESYDNLVLKHESQQKEYIKQLEKLAYQDMILSDFANGCKVAYGIALNRYKEIIGV